MTHKPDAVELKPCPFCGTQPMLLATTDSGGELYCVSCSITWIKPWSSWNTRDTAELDALRREVEAGKPKWIPIPQMPSDEGLYLLTVLESYSTKTEIAIRKLCKDDDGEVYFPFSAGKVLAWQPLPEPYTEGNNDDR